MLLYELPVIFHWIEKWGRYLDFDVDLIKPNMKSYYYPPTESKKADIALKLFHHALPHPNQTSHFAVGNLRECLVCHQDEGSLFNRFFTCGAQNNLKVTSTLCCRNH